MNDRVNEIKKREKEASPKPWGIYGSHNDFRICSENKPGQHVVTFDTWKDPRREDLDFMVEAREDIPFLLDLLEKTQADLECMKKTSLEERRFLTARAEKAEEECTEVEREINSIKKNYGLGS